MSFLHKLVSPENGGQKDLSSSLHSSRHLLEFLASFLKVLWKTNVQRLSSSYLEKEERDVFSPACDSRPQNTAKADTGILTKKIL